MVAQVAPQRQPACSSWAKPAPARSCLPGPLHHASHRADNRFVAFNCAAFAQELLVSELVRARKGLLHRGQRHQARPVRGRQRGNGASWTRSATCPRPCKVKLLRVIQEKELTRVGGTEPIPVDVRIVAATHQRPYGPGGRRVVFRSDLYYRHQRGASGAAAVAPAPRRHPAIGQSLFTQARRERQGKDTSELSQRGHGPCSWPTIFPEMCASWKTSSRRAVTPEGRGTAWRWRILPEEVQGAAVSAAEPNPGWEGAAAHPGGEGVRVHKAGARAHRGQQDQGGRNTEHRSSVLVAQDQKIRTGRMSKTSRQQ